MKRAARLGSVAAVALAVLAFIATAITGCQTPRRTFKPERDPSTLSDTSFIHYLATVPVVTVDEGMRAVLLLVDGPTDASTFQQRKTELVRMGAFKDSWRLCADHTLDKGTLAYMLRTVCQLRPSINERLAASTRLGERRYALRTCVRKSLFRPGLAADPVTGGELLSAVTQAEPFIPPRSGESK